MDYGIELKTQPDFSNLQHNVLWDKIYYIGNFALTEL